MMAPFTPINTGPCEISFSSTNTGNSTHELQASQPVRPSKLREVIMYAVQSLELSKRIPVGKTEKETVQKRKLPLQAQVSDFSDKSISKRPKIAERNINETSRAKMTAQGSPTALSANTMSKLNAFRFQAPLESPGIPKEPRQLSSFSNGLQYSETHEELILSSDPSDIAVSDVEKACTADERAEFTHVLNSTARNEYNDRLDISDQKEQNHRFVWHDMDDLDESVFDQLIADDEADWGQPPPSAPRQTACFTSDPISTSTKSSLMPPPKLPAPAMLPARSTYVSHQKPAMSPPASMSPFVRAGTKAPIFLSSMIPNFNSSGRILTCFRLAELLRHISSSKPFEPDRCLQIAPIELFATVTASRRNQNGTEQRFTFADLFFPQRPPYIEGTYLKCAKSELFDDDSRPFLESSSGGHGILARTIVRPRKAFARDTHSGTEVDTRRTTDLEVLSIWACTWDDIEYTKGIVMPESEAS